MIRILFLIGHNAIESYLNRADVRVAIHAVNCPHHFVECSDPPYNALSHQDGKGVTDELIYILQENVRVMIYAGQFDLICNHLGIEKLLLHLNWTGRSDWLEQKPGIWIIDDEPAGYVTSHLNLQYVRGKSEV